MAVPVPVHDPLLEPGERSPGDAEELGGLGHGHPVVGGSATAVVAEGERFTLQREGQVR